MRRKKLIFGTVCVSLLGLIVLSTNAGKKPSASKGVHQVEMLLFPKLKDEDRQGRVVPIKVHYPAEQGEYPVLIFSHGGMGTWDSHLYDARYLASHGYIAVCIEHTHSNNIKTKAHMRNVRGSFKQKIDAAIMKITTDPQAVLERPRDVSFAIDRIIEWNKTEAKLKGKVDSTKIAVIGHSYGAYSVLTACGARPILDYLDPPVQPGKGLSGDLSDSRITVGVAMSPQGPGTSRLGKESYKTINRPILCLTGSMDTQYGHDGIPQPAKRRLEGFKLIPDDIKQLLWLENTDHLAFADNPKAWMLPSKSRKDTQRIVVPVMHAWCDFHLKGKTEAKARLTEEFANSLCGDVVTKVTWLKTSDDADLIIKGE